VIFAREVDTRAVDFNNGDVSVVNLDCRDGRKCCDGRDCSTEDLSFDFEFHLNDVPPVVGIVTLKFYQYVQANATNSTQVANLTLEIQILIEL
jgi:hypothetical protein